MPEHYRKHVYLLSQAEKHARYAAIWCRYCKKRRYFLLSELREAFGDIDCDSVVDNHNWNCTNCKGRGRIDFRIEDPPASGGAMVRSLVRVDVVRKPIWSDRRA